MQDNIHSADKLIAKITEVAGQEAGRILDAASSECDKIALITENDIFDIDNETRRKTASVHENIMERSRTNASLDARKYALAARRALVDEAFDEAYRKLVAIKGEERAALISKLLSREVEGGETVLPAKADEATAKAAVEKLNPTLRAKGLAELTLGSATDKAEAGFILKAEGYEKNCSFASMLLDARTTSESEVAAILFD